MITGKVTKKIFFPPLFPLRFLDFQPEGREGGKRSGAISRMSRQETEVRRRKTSFLRKEHVFLRKEHIILRKKQTFLRKEQSLLPKKRCFPPSPFRTAVWRTGFPACTMPKDFIQTGKAPRPTQTGSLPSIPDPCDRQGKQTVRHQFFLTRAYIYIKVCRTGVGCRPHGVAAFRHFQNKT